MCQKYPWLKIMKCQWSHWRTEDEQMMTLNWPMEDESQGHMMTTRSRLINNDTDAWFCCSVFELVWNMTGKGHKWQAATSLLPPMSTCSSEVSPSFCFLKSPWLLSPDLWHPPSPLTHPHRRQPPGRIPRFPTVMSYWWSCHFGHTCSPRQHHHSLHPELSSYLKQKTSRFSQVLHSSLLHICCLYSDVINGHQILFLTLKVTFLKKDIILTSKQNSKHLSKMNRIPVSSNSKCITINTMGFQRSSMSQSRSRIKVWKH